MFSSRVRKKPNAVPIKRKWAVSESDDSDDEKKKGSDDDGDLSCSICKSESDVFCLECKAYFCLGDFAKKHKDETGDGGAKQHPGKKQKGGSDSDSDGKETEEEGEANVKPHKFRALVGVESYRLDTLAVGWEVSRDEPQSKISQRKRAKDAEKEAARAIARERSEAIEAKEKEEEEAVAAAQAVIAKQKADAEYLRVTVEAEMRNKRDLNKGILPKSLKSNNH